MPTLTPKLETLPGDQQQVQDTPVQPVVHLDPEREQVKKYIESAIKSAVDDFITKSFQENKGFHWGGAYYNSEAYEGNYSKVLEAFAAEAAKQKPEDRKFFLDEGYDKFEALVEASFKDETKKQKLWAEILAAERLTSSLQVNKIEIPS